MNIEITIDGDVDQDAAGAIVAGLAECARLDAAAGELARLRDAGAVLLNQSVLLRGVNDELGTLEALSQRLFAAGVLPYYPMVLHRGGYPDGS